MRMFLCWLSILVSFQSCARIKQAEGEVGEEERRVEQRVLREMIRERHHFNK